MPSRRSVSTHRLLSQFISGVIATVLTAGVVLAVTSRGPAEALTMPRSGVITVTGYEMISVMNPSSGAESLVLTPAESRRLVRVADGVAVTNVNGMCHENSVIFSISVAATMGGRPFWTAVDAECPAPGQLTVMDSRGVARLMVHSCSLLRFLAALYPGGAIEGTRSDVRFCGA